MGRKIKIILLEGLSIDNKGVYSGVYKFQNTHGVSLFEILEFFKENNYLISWRDYIKDAINFGKKAEALRTDILTSVLDSGFIKDEEFEQFICKIDLLFHGDKNDTTIPK